MPTTVRGNSGGTALTTTSVLTTQGQEVQVVNYQSGALATVASVNGIASWMVNLVLIHSMISGTTSATTFKVRAGGNSGLGTTTFNGSASARKLGGSLASSITITEYVP